MNKLNQIKHSTIAVLSLALMVIATAAASTSSAFMWYEPVCPKELLK